MEVTHVVSESVLNQCPIHYIPFSCLGVRWAHEAIELCQPGPLGDSDEKSPPPQSACSGPVACVRISLLCSLTFWDCLLSQHDGAQPA